MAGLIVKGCVGIWEIARSLLSSRDVTLTIEEPLLTSTWSLTKTFRQYCFRLYSTESMEEEARTRI